MSTKSFSAGVPLCAICHKIVWLEEAKTDEEGRAIHEECYVSTLGPIPALPNRLPLPRELLAARQRKPGLPR
jgi:hypothetical protein